jgi:hypothetical protein
MSGMVDGVSKFFIVYHDGGAMHMEGFTTTEDMAIAALCIHSWRGNWVERAEAFKSRLEALIERENNPPPVADEDSEIDGGVKL